MGALMRQFAKAALDQERANAPVKGLADAALAATRQPSMARTREPASTDDVERLEEIISDMQQIQLAQFEAMSAKLEEVLSNMYV